MSDPKQSKTTEDVIALFDEENGVVFLYTKIDCFNSKDGMKVAYDLRWIESDQVQLNPTEDLYDKADKMLLEFFAEKLKTGEYDDDATNDDYTSNNPSSSVAAGFDSGC